MKINWLNDNKPKSLYFSDIEVRQGFRNASSLSQGAVYIKVEDHNAFPDSGHSYAMMEVVTGKMFKPTHAPVEIVELELSIAVEKPSIYE